VWKKKEFTAVSLAIFSGPASTSLEKEHEGDMNKSVLTSTAPLTVSTGAELAMAQLKAEELNGASSTLRREAAEQLGEENSSV
jgi:hypothetical protein